MSKADTPKITGSEHGSARQLAAIVFLDVVGYTRSMELNGEATHALWMDTRRNCIEPLVFQNAGEIIKSTGDGLLVEFHSSFDAVTFSLNVQQEMDNARKPNDANLAPLTLRISIHIDEITRGVDDIYGDGVNVAARLLEFADAGGIIISASVNEQVHRAIDYHSADLGFINLKNIERRVRAFKISPLQLTAPTSINSIGHRPSIAVLPFQSLSNAEDDGYFSEGIIHEIVASLAVLRELFVVSSTSTLAFTNSSMPPARICHALGVRYLVTGTFHRSDDRIRLMVQLHDIDAQSVIWANRFETTLPELFTMQDSIATKIAHAVLPQIRNLEVQRAMRKPPQSMDAYDVLLKGQYHMYRLGKENLTQARACFEDVISRDPHFALAYALLAKCCFFLIAEGYSKQFVADSGEALRFASKALDLDPMDPLALAIYGHINALLYEKFDVAIDAFDRAIDVNPNSAVAWGLSGSTYSFIGDGPKAINCARFALSLAPLDPFSSFYRTVLTLANFVNGSYEESVLWGQKTLAVSPRFTANLRMMTASLSALGRMEEARNVAAQLMALDPTFSVKQFCTWYPLQQRERRDQLEQLLLAAGLPE